MNDRKLSIQEYLSLGYIYLLVLGIGSDMIYYGLLGINILSYSTISDVLLSPVSLIGHNIVIPLTLITAVLILFYVNKLGPKYHEKLKNKNWYQKLHDVEKLNKRYKEGSTSEDILKGIAIGLLFLFLGLRTGMGLAVKKRMQNGNLKFENSIEFVNGKEQKIALLGQNSLYLFYIEEARSKLTITPIETNIRKITEIEMEENTKR